jgi:DNA repair protein RecN (Recombination protein N)
MLIELSVENIAIMDQATARFGPGFTSITGETGAGKSLLIGAISLCLGERADLNLIRKGASRAFVLAVFDPPATIRKMLAEIGYPIGNEELFLQREIAAEGKSISRINGKAAPVGIIKQIGDVLIDLHGQHDHQSLIHSSKHTDVLDEFGGEDVIALRSEVARIWSELASVRMRIEEMRRDVQERERAIDVLRYQIQEIVEFGVKVGEVAEASATIKLLQGAENLQQFLLEAQDALNSGETTAKSLTQIASHALARAAEYDEQLRSVHETLGNVQLSLEEVSMEIKRSLESVEFNPEKIEGIAKRLDEYNSLKRKYGETEDQILIFLARAESELQRLESIEQASEELIERESTLTEEYEFKASRLTEKRINTAETFSAAVQEQLKELGMRHARFVAQLSSREASKSGREQCEFLLSANVGEDVKPLAKIASGGEISRVMLAIKTAMADSGGVPTLIFDEIDTGLGGKTAAIVARKLAELGKNYQVLAITHVPQIASAAGAQISIDKTESSGVTSTQLRQLDPEARVLEIARMVGGVNVTDEAVANARQLLNS